MKKKRIVYLLGMLIMGISLSIISCDKDDDDNDDNNNNSDPNANWNPGLDWTDIRDGQSYKTVKIDSQIWMAENLNYYTPTGSWYYNDDSITYANTYGRFYNQTIAKVSCPSGWHLPSEDEWWKLIKFCDYDGGKLKDTGNAYWQIPNEGATNETGFTALATGIRWYDDWYYTTGYADIDSLAVFWSSTKAFFPGEYFVVILEYDHKYINNQEWERNNGISVRCVKD